MQIMKRDLNTIYQRLNYLKRNKPEFYDAFVDCEGQCQDCGSTMDVDVKKYDTGIRVACRSCRMIFEQSRNLNMSPEVYTKERETIVKEIINRLEKKVKSNKKNNQKDVDRDMEIVNQVLLGRSYAHIGDMFGISRERVRQIYYKYK